MDWQHEESPLLVAQHMVTPASTHVNEAESLKRANYL